MNFAGKILAVGDPSRGVKIYATLEDLYADYCHDKEAGDIEVCLLLGMLYGTKDTNGIN